MSERAAWLDAALAFAVAAILSWGVLVLGWPVFAVMALFWIENVIIGVFNVARMLLTGLRGGPALLAGSVLLAAFFTVHYGMFTAIHGVFVVMLFGVPELGRDAMNGGLFAPLARMLGALVADREGALAVLGLVAFQFAAFVQWVIATRTRPAVLNQLMSAPYGRIVVLHLTLIAGGFVVSALGMPVAGALVLIGAKLLYDLKGLRSGRTPLSPEHQKAVQLLTIGRRRLSGRP